MPALIPLTADYIQCKFQPDLSPLGSTNCHLEEAIIISWIQYLHRVEGT